MGIPDGRHCKICCSPVYSTTENVDSKQQYYGYRVGTVCNVMVKDVVSIAIEVNDSVLGFTSPTNVWLEDKQFL